MISFSRLFILCGCFAVTILCASANETTPDAQNRKQPKTHIFKGFVRYNIHKNELVGLDNHRPCTESPEFELNYITWKIEVCKGSLTSKDFLMVRLVSVFREKVEEWSCEVEASFKILSKDPYNSARTRFACFNYNRVHLSPFKRVLVGWDELLNEYMIDDVATLEVTIKIKPPKRIPSIQHTSTKFEMRLLDVKTFDRLYSEEASVHGMRWKVLALKFDEYLGVFVLTNEDDMDLDHAWKVSATVELFSMDPDKTVTRTFSAIQFDSTSKNRGFHRFIQWTDLMDPNNKFVIDNTVLLQIELNIEESKPIK